MASKFYFLVFFFLLLSLALRFYFFYKALPRYIDGQKVQFRLLLQQEPELANGMQELITRIPAGNTLVVHTASKYIYNYGDSLTVSGILKTKTSSSGQESYVMYYPKIVAEPQELFLWSWARMVRDKSRSLYNNTLPPVSANLLMGIVFGIKEQYSQDFLQDLRTVGVLHVIAASGMNVSFVAGAVMFSLGSFLKRRLSLFLTILVIIFYTFIVGFQASILRASIMAVVAFTASIFGRQSIALLSIGLTAFIMLFLQPSLLFDVSFQLSFLSTIGILLVKPLLDGGLGKLGNVGKLELLTGDITTTMAAQIGTLPVMLGTFGNYGLLSIFVNALVLWTVPILMTTGSLAVVFGFIFEPLSKIFLWVSYPFLLFFQIVVSFFGNSGLLISLQNVPVEIWIGYYCLLLGLVAFAQIRKNKPEITKVNY